ncbi:hypothetical protein [Mycobacterium sp. Aquia_213]|uniref:hypothetical protein n=1 Tax=Mycobacterium sp. Aquia_213 TaxID=2991728 RepID=UPI0022718D8A|nr:hypothetical protein [Mycobacterium sp. Aquia_213]WAC89585.1 hypothetical protein LMQ14_16610 [Mycobacterium sp. Aquia_213]
MTTNSLRLRGIELRYVLTWHLALHGAAAVPDLIHALAHHNFDAGARPSKSISDALRWEIRYGRVVRLARGWYGPGCMPRGTEHRIHQRVLALRARAESLRGGQIDRWLIACGSEPA